MGRDLIYILFFGFRHKNVNLENNLCISGKVKNGLSKENIPIDRLPMLRGSIQSASCFSTSPLVPNLWKVHFVIRGKM